MSASSYPKPAQFDGGRFAARYGLDAMAGDFWADENFIYVRDGITLPDDPPIFDPPLKLDPAPDDLGFTGTMRDLLEE